MRTLSTRGRMTVLASVVAIWATLGYACSAEDENPATGRARGTDAGGDGTVDPNNNNNIDNVPVLCGKYGGYANVKTIAAAVIAEASQDCRIQAPLAALDAEGTQHLAECFEILMGNAFKCEGVTYIGGTTTDSNDRKCRTMANAHDGLNLRKADFDAFTQDIAKALAAKGVAPEDVKALAPVFEGYRTGVVQTNNQPDRNTHCSCANGEYMGKPCLPEQPIIDGGNDTGTDASMDAPDDG